MDFTEQKKQIIAQMKRSDKKAIAERACVSRGTAHNALLKSSLNDMSQSEKRFWIAAVEFINERLNKS